MRKFQIFLSNNSRLLEYLINGIAVNFIGLLLYIFLIKIIKLSAIASLTIQYPLIIFIYFLSQNYFVFKISFKFKNMVKFILNIIFLYIVNVIVLIILIEKFNINVILSQFFCLILLSFINYMISKKIIFTK